MYANTREYSNKVEISTDIPTKWNIRRTLSLSRGMFNLPKKKRLRKKVFFTPPIKEEGEKKDIRMNIFFDVKNKRKRDNQQSIGIQNRDTQNRETRGGRD